MAKIDLRHVTTADEAKAVMDAELRAATRVLRAATREGLLREVKPGRFAITRKGEELVESMPRPRRRR